LCVSATTDMAHGNRFIDEVSVARGNIVLADHGRTIAQEGLGVVPQPRLFLPAASGSRCKRPDRIHVPPRFHPALAQAPLTQAASLDGTASAYAAMHWDLAAVVPSIALAGTYDSTTEDWQSRRDLIGSADDDRHFVVEVESDGTTTLRFGDDQNGVRPPSDTDFAAGYRIGNGTAGNVGANALAHAVTDIPGIGAVRNPLPARGGTDRETSEEVRTRAPYAFRTQQRAVTPDDYGDVSERNAQVQQAAATFRWTGSWHTVFITVDRTRGLPVDAAFKSDMERYVEPYRMAGYDLDIDAPRFVPIEVEMLVCVKPDYFRDAVKQALMNLFSNRVLPDGTLGLFHPDNFSFAQPVFLSRLYVAAQGVAGVDSVTITKFQRQGIADLKPLEVGHIDLGRLEIARLDNDRNFPDRGTFQLELGGGK